LVQIEFDECRHRDYELRKDSYIMPPQRGERRRMNALSHSLHLVAAAARFTIGDCVVDIDTHRITRDGVEQRVAAKSISVLTCLLGHAGQVVSRDRLLGEVWSSATASDELLTQAIRELRRAFRDDPRVPQYIETIPKGGYRLIAAVQPHTAELPLQGLDDLPPASNELHPAPSPAASRSLIMFATLGVALLIAAAALILMLRTPAPIATGTTFSTPKSLTSGYGAVEFPTLSPDGALVAYAARLPSEMDSRIYVQTSGGSQPLALGASIGASDTYPVWSPDGKSIAFMRMNAHECNIHVVAATGGASRPLHACFRNSVQYFDWTPDGKALITQAMPEGARHLELTLLGVDDGEYRELDYPRDAANDDLVPHYSPDGKFIAFRRGQNPFSDLYVMHADGTQLRRLTSIHAAIAGFAWLPDSQRIAFSSYFEDRTRLYVTDARSGAIAATEIADSVFPATSRHAPRLAAVRDLTGMNLAEYDLAGAPEPSVRAPSGGIDVWPAYAHATRGLCFVSDRSGSWQLWSSAAPDEEPVALTHFEGNEVLSHPVWSPDDTHILFVAQHVARSRLLSLEVATGRLQELGSANENIRAARYAPDGGALDVVSDRDGSWKLWRYAPDSDAHTLLLDEPVIAFDYGPDGALYYTNANAPGLYRKLGAQHDSFGHEFTAANRMAWQAGRDGIYFVEQVDAQHSNLRLLRWNEHESTVVRQLGGFGAELAIAVDAQSKHFALPAMSRLANSVIVSELVDAAKP
jgi:Tol biopolymer transport system component/DNA-binding winged helix-turn-helix (wHTH) protein